MKSQLLDTATGKKLYKLKEKLVWQKRLGRGVATVDVSRFGASENSDIQDHLHTLALLLNLFTQKLFWNWEPEAENRQESSTNTANEIPYWVEV